MLLIVVRKFPSHPPLCWVFFLFSRSWYPLAHLGLEEYLPYPRQGVLLLGWMPLALPSVLSVWKSRSTRQALGRYVWNISAERKRLNESGHACEGLSQGQVWAMRTCILRVADGYKLPSMEHLPNSGHHSEHFKCTEWFTPWNTPWYRDHYPHFIDKKIEVQEV